MSNASLRTNYSKIKQCADRIAQLLIPLYGLDLRSLALYRMMLAALHLANLILLLPYVGDFYTDQGLIPRDVAVTASMRALDISVHMLNGSLWFQYLLFAINGLVLVLWFIGYRSKLMSILAWFFLISLFSRNVFILNGGDELLTMLTFWGMFLPLGAKFSVDQALNSKPQVLPERVFSGATVALLIQVCSVYWFTLYLKSGTEWHEYASAVFMALQIDQMVTPIGEWVRSWPKQVLAQLTHLTYFAEYLAPFLLLFPIKIALFRMTGVLLVIVMHLSFGLGLELGIFPWIDVAAALPFIPSALWQKLGRIIRTPERLGLRIYYDADCGFCKKLVYLMRTFLLLPEVQLATAQSTPETTDRMLRENSWVVQDAHGNSYTKIRALWLVLSQSYWNPLGTRLPLPRAIETLGNQIYHWVANHRQQISPWLSWLTFRPVAIRYSLLLSLTSLFLMVYTFLMNLSSIHALDYIDVGFTFPGPKTSWIRDSLHLHQFWGMFSPFPMTQDGWFVIPATFQDGHQGDLMQQGRPVSWTRPPSITAMYEHNDRWAKIMMNLSVQDFDASNSRWRDFARFLCRKWNADRANTDPKLLLSFDLYFMQDPLPSFFDHPAPSPEPIKKLQYGHWNCYPNGTGAEHLFQKTNARKETLHGQ